MRVLQILLIRFMEGPDEGSEHDFTRLTKMGFEYKYGMKKILDDSISYGRRFGAL